MTHGSVLPEQHIAAGTLWQHVSIRDYRKAPLHFGRSGGNRYDDPAGRAGVLYLAPDLSTALMESVFHRHQWSRCKRTVTLSEIDRRIVRIVGAISDLYLADLTAPNVMAACLGLNLYQLSSRNYRYTQSITTRVLGTPMRDGTPFDGLLYPSRNNYPAVCLALFETAAPKLVVLDDLPLSGHRDWPAFVVDFGIAIIPV